LKNNKGFTLIELIVVIAIIAVLSAIVLTNTVQYFSKAKDAAVKDGMRGLLVLAHQYFEGHNLNYGGFCEDNLTRDVFDSLHLPTDYGCDNSPETWRTCCHDDFDDWAACARLNLPAGGNKAWCIDSDGVSMEINKSDCKANITSCQ
jgi:prepilin-type N-terminal cleavage/methylation domain-containing protein